MDIKYLVNGRTLTAYIIADSLPTSGDLLKMVDRELAGTGWKRYAKRTVTPKRDGWIIDYPITEG